MMLHFIRHGDTLQNIADQINLENPVYIKEFHNQKCSGEDYISEDLVVGKKLFLPDRITVQNYNSRNDAPFKNPEKNPKLNFLPVNSDLKYKVNIKESSFDNGKKSENSFSYDFSLKWIRSEYNHHTFQFSKTNFSNIKEKLGDLANGCLQSLNPIQLETNWEGEIEAINILEKTLKNFPKIKEKLLDQFPDKYAKIYIDEFEYAVLNQELFQKKMKQDWLLKTFFAPIRKPFKNGKSHFKIFLENKNSEIEIEQKGILNNEVDEVVLSQGLMSDDKQNDFTGKYILSAETGLIKSLEIINSYSEYDVSYSTEMKIDQI